MAVNWESQKHYHAGNKNNTNRNYPKGFIKKIVDFIKGLFS